MKKIVERKVRKMKKSFEEIYENVCITSKERLDEVKRKNN